MVGDFVHNLRSALDHFVWQLVLLDGGKPSRESAFPVATHGQAYWCVRKDGSPSIRDRCLRGVSEAHRTRIDALQPYRAGEGAPEHALYLLNRLWNMDKHRVLHATLLATGEPDPSQFEFQSAGEGIVDVTFSSRLVEDGAVIMRLTVDPPDTQVKVKGQIPVVIGFGPPVEGEPAIRAQALATFLNAVKGILDSFCEDFGEQSPV
jgi:hypothetical protein